MNNDDRLVGSRGTYEVTGTTADTKPCIGFEAEAGTEIDEITIVKDDAPTTALANPISTFITDEGSGVLTLGGLYALPKGYTCTSIKLTSGTIKKILKTPQS